MIKDAMQFLLGHAEIREIKPNGLPHLVGGNGFLEPMKPAIAKPLVVQTLSGLVDYIKTNRDELNWEQMLLHVDSFEKVSLVSKLEDDWRRRVTYLVASHDREYNEFRFGEKYDIETFIIKMQANFVPTAHLVQVMKLAGNITSEAVQNNVDDGVTQTITTRDAVNFKVKEQAPSQVELKPYRTFLDCEQPASKFVFRVHQDRDGQPPRLALYDAEGGKWKLHAVGAIVNFLKENIGDTVAIMA